MHDMDRRYLEAESEAFEFTAEGEFSGEIFGEGEINELATELMSVSSEVELDHFLGGLIKKVGGAVGRFVKSPLGQQLGGMLKGVAKQALPMVGSALGNLVVPGVGGMIGGKLASAAGSALGLELEGLSQEDREFEVAKQFVRLASDATRTALAAPQTASASAVARDAIAKAAQRYAPGLLGSPSGQPNGGLSGRWVRRGRKIVLYGV